MACGRGAWGMGHGAWGVGCVGADLRVRPHLI
jgi:hypothetical protein